MSALRGHLDEYLTARRALGFKLVHPGRILAQMVAHVEAAGSPVLTCELMIEWAQLPGSAAPITVSHRIGAARKFAVYMAAIDPATEIPAPGVLAARQIRQAPYLWSQSDIVRLLRAAARLSPDLHARTCQTLFGLLAVTGMRVGEALRLTGRDADLAEGVLTVRESKFGRSRLVPLHPQTTEALTVYAAHRSRTGHGDEATGAFFVNRHGRALRYASAHTAFVGLTIELGLRTATVHPRMHDLRHSFAVNTLIGWYRAGDDVGARIGVLSTYLGHVAPSGTYWYLTAVPELMELAATRLDTSGGTLR